MLLKQGYVKLGQDKPKEVRHEFIKAMEEGRGMGVCAYIKFRIF